jgi:hypothetical protein
MPDSDFTGAGGEEDFSVGVVEPRGDLAIKNEVLISAEYFAAYKRKSRKSRAVMKMMHQRLAFVLWALERHHINKTKRLSVSREPRCCCGCWIDGSLR